ncbi:MAG: DUF4396 domain-containing protein [Chloroflexia bacterium]
MRWKGSSNARRTVVPTQPGIQRHDALPYGLRDRRSAGTRRATLLGWSALLDTAATVLAFIFAGLTMRPLLASGMAFAQAAGLAFAADTISITVMEIVDNLILLVIPGAMEAGLNEQLFWGSLAIALAVAFVVAFPVSMWLISRGRGHALVHDHN